jgi:hypothetical protein
MAFITVRGLKGKVYVPDPPKEGARKHSCKDCYACQLCSDDRCSVCLSPESCRCEKYAKGVQS